ncbi:MAG: Tim44/TimA family putative adaptor protein [Alphaproteobacteria bacterium]
MTIDIVLLITLLVIGFLAFRFLTKPSEEDSSQLNENAANNQPANKPAENSNKKQMDELFRMPKSAQAAAQTDVQNERLEKFKVTPPKDSVNAGLAALKESEPKFSIKKFTAGAKIAFSEIVEAFAGGNRELLKRRVGDAVYKTFDAEITRREAQNEILEIHIRDFKIVDIIRAKIENGIARIKVKFVTHQTYLLKDTNGQVVRGEEDVPQEFRDIWTFERKVGSTNPNWVLVNTSAESY